MTRTHLTKREALILETLAASHTGMVGLELQELPGLRSGSIYWTLHTLEDEGLVHSREEARPLVPGSTRRRYDITVPGCRALDTLQVRETVRVEVVAGAMAVGLFAWWLGLVLVNCRAAGWC